MVPPRSPPAMISTCSSIVAITGNSVSGSNSLDEAPARPTTLREYSMTMHCRPRQRPSTGMPFSRAKLQRAELALDAAHAESAGHADAVEVGELLLRALGRLALVGGDPLDLDLGLVARTRRRASASVTER